jgi:hypothetical protein
MSSTHGPRNQAIKKIYSALCSVARRLLCRHVVVQYRVVSEPSPSFLFQDDFILFPVLYDHAEE